MMTKPAKLRRSPRDLPRAPAHLEPPEAKLWRAIVTDFEFRDAASIALLAAALEARQRSRRCREVVDRDGEAVQDRFGQTKPHPLLMAERDARSAFLAAMRVLNLDIAGETK
jgi:phage terminase small subunit